MHFFTDLVPIDDKKTVMIPCYRLQVRLSDELNQRLIIYSESSEFHNTPDFSRELASLLLHGFSPL